MDEYVKNKYPFVGFPKIPRLLRDIIVTEKIDGTNGCLFVDDNILLAGSKSRWLSSTSDNHGFWVWAMNNKRELVTRLGPGLHHGEWWGSGIQRKYGLKGGEKHFSLFNTSKWEDAAVRPECCDVVPVLYRGPFDLDEVLAALDRLSLSGSIAAPGFSKPEGVVVFHTAGNLMFKVTIERDDQPKGVRA